MKRTALVVVAILIGAAGTAFAATPKTLRFATVAHAQRPVGADEPAYPRAQRIDETQGFVVADATHMTFNYTDFPAADQRKFDALDWNAHFVFLAVLKKRTSGFRVTIRRVVLQRISRSTRQLCVIACVEKPRAGEPVVSRPYFSAHAVALSNARFRIDQFHYAIPTRFVLRGANGQLLAVSRIGGARDFYTTPSGKPKLCTLASRASDEPLG